MWKKICITSRKKKGNFISKFLSANKHHEQKKEILFQNFYLQYRLRYVKVSVSKSKAIKTTLSAYFNLILSFDFYKIQYFLSFLSDYFILIDKNPKKIEFRFVSKEIKVTSYSRF